MISLAFAVGSLAAEEPADKPFVFAPYHDAQCFCVSRDGKKVAVDCWAIWEIATGKRLLEGETHGAWGMAFSPDGSLLAVCGNWGEFYVYDAVTGKVVWNLTLVGHGDTVLKQVEFTPDGRYMVSSSLNSMLRVWNVKEKKAEALFCFATKCKDEAHNGYKDYLRDWRALHGDKPPDDVKTFVVFDREPIYFIHRFAISPDGKLIALALGTSEVRILEWASGKILQTFHTEQVYNVGVCFSPDGKLLAVGGGDDKPNTGKCTIEIWDVAAGKRLVTCPGQSHSAGSLAFSPDGKTLVSSGGRDVVRVWDVATGKEKVAVHKEDNAYMSGVAFLPDGKTFLTLPATKGASVHFWDATTGKKISPIKK